MSFNLNESWNGLSGQEVREGLQAAIKQRALKSNAVGNITFELDSENNSKINYEILSVDNESLSTGSFEVSVPVSGYDTTIYNFNAPSYIEPGQSAEISFEFIIEQGNELVSGYKLQVTLTINGQTLPVFMTPSSYRNQHRRCSYTINSEWLREGVNTIKLSARPNIDGAIGSPATFDEGTTDTKIINSFKARIKGGFKTTANAYEAEKTLFPNVSTTLVLDAQIIDRQNNNILSTYTGSTIEWIVYNEVGTKLPALNISSIGTSISISTLSGILDAGYTGECKFYLQGVVTVGTNKIYTNIIAYCLVVKDNLTHLSYKFDDFRGYEINGDTYSIDINSIPLVYTLYDTFKLASVEDFGEYELKSIVYVYAPSDIDLPFKFSGDEQAITTVSLEGNENQLQSIDFQYILKESGEKFFAVGNNLIQLSLSINSIGNDLVTPVGAILSLTANGKSGHDEEWASGIYAANLDGFNFSSNGWIDNALVINDNATVTIPISPFNKVIGDGLNNTVPGRTISIRYKTSIDDPTEELIRCVLRDLSGVSQADGFVIRSQRATLYKGTTNCYTEFDSSDTKEVTFVWYNSQYGNTSIIYINGTSQVVLQESTSIALYSNIIINAVSTQLYLYDINIYDKALTFSEVQALYNANNAKDVSNYIIKNAIFNSSVTLGNNGQKVTPESLPVGSTYMLIKAFKGAQGPDKPWEVINLLAARENGKETKSWNVLAGETYLITKVATGLTPNENNFYADRIAFSGQGTSSMAYPIKNFRIYFKKKLTSAKKAKAGWNSDVYGNITEDNNEAEFKILEKTAYTQVFVKGSDVTGIDYHPVSGDELKAYSIHDNIPAQTFCLKADFAESSGMHNTGFARLANDALEASNTIAYSTNAEAHLPHNRTYSGEINEYTYRSTIDGILLYLFFADKNDNIYYHGKYNLNYDKAAAAVFGFEPYDKDNDPYFAQIEGEALLLAGLFNTTLEEFGQGHVKIEGTNIVNPTECWEFSTNDPRDIAHYSQLASNNLHQIGAFTFPYNLESGYPYYNQLGGNNLDPFTEIVSLTNETDGGKLAWINTEQAWEPRYPDDDDVTEYYEDGGTPYLLKSLYKWIHRNNVYCRGDESKDTYAGIFALNLDKYFNVDYLIKYYVLTKMFINSDQRIKNCMLAFYFDPNVEINAGNTSGTQGCPMGHMRAYYIFYDNDTILGVDNDGNLNNVWNSDEITTYFPNGITIDNNATVNYTEDVSGNKHVPFHGIWGNLEYCYNLYISGRGNANVKSLGEKIEKAYRELRIFLTDEKIDSYLNSKLPDAADNVDLEVKYFYPTTLNHGDGQTDFQYLNKYQGNRKYHRNWLLNKRTKWFDSRYGAGTINNYFLTYKVLGSSQFQDKNISLTTAIDKWRFYLQDAEASNEKSALCYKVDGGQGKPATVTLLDKSTSNSFERTIKGLYAAKSIDWTNYYYDSEGYAICPVSNRTLPLLNVKSFTIGNATTPVNYYRNTLQNFFTSGDNNTTKVIMPNLETLKILNTRLINNFSAADGGDEDIFEGDTFSLNLSLYTKLNSIDTSNTLMSLILPSGSSLTTLKMQRPTTLNFVDKTNLSSIIIADRTSLDTLVANTCSNYVYEWVLSEYIDRKSIYDSYKDQELNPVVKVTVVFNDTRNELSSEIIDLLLLLALTSNPGLSVSGDALYTSLTSEQGSILSVFTELNIITQYSDEFNFTFSAGTDLRENSDLGIGSTLNVDSTDSWGIEWINAGAGNILENYVHVTATAPKRCIITADPIWNNNEITGSFKIKATYGGEEIISDQVITVKYVPIKNIKLVPEKDIVTLGITKINISIVNADCTKSHLLTAEANSEHNFSHAVTVSPAAESCVISYTNGMHIEYSPNENIDSKVTLTLGGNKTASVIMYYDIPLCYKTDAENTTGSLSWIYSLLENQWSLIDSERIYRSTLHKYKISTDNGTVKRGNQQIPSWDTNTDLTHDLTFLQYFDCENSFTIPSSFKFTNLCIPEGVNSVRWTSTMSSTPYSSYGTITFPSTTNVVYISLSGLDNPYTSLKFDLTRAKNITRIYKPSSENNMITGDFGLYISYNNTPQGTYDQTHPLFDYYQEVINGQVVGSIKLIGTFVETVGNSIASPTNGMFDISGLNYTSGLLTPLFYLGAPICDPESKLKVGCISNYCMSQEALNWDAIASNIVGLSYTFYNGSGIPSELTLNNITFIGDGTFYTGNTLLTLGDKVDTFGCSAFLRFAGIINSTTQNNRTTSIVNSSVSTVLGPLAFGQMSSNYIFRFNTTRIGDNAITGYTDVESTIEVHLLNTTPPTIVSQPFNTKVDLFVKSELRSWADTNLDGMVKSITTES